MQWSLPLLFSLVQDSPPDGLSHTLWRTGGGERGGDPKKAGKLSLAEKENRFTAFD